MKKIDFAFDYHKLLADAKKARAKFELAYKSSSDEKEIGRAFAEWYKWQKDNITRRGVQLQFDFYGKPVAITAVLAGKM